MENSIIIQTKQLSIGYTIKNIQNCIAQNLNLNFQKGKLITLIGANGVGKSTLLKTLTSIQKPLYGEVILNNLNIHRYTDLELAKNLSVVLTEKLPPSNLTIYELVALGRQPYTNWLGTLTEEDHTKIKEALILTEITSIQHKKHYEISDGQLQKALIARALAQDTSLIILDEPTTHLDLHHKVSVFKLLKKLAHETQKCILFSTHDLDLAIQISDEMVVMTPDFIIQNEPCLLIEKGIFNLLFKDHDITFDNEKGKFLFK
ncbi:MULTISPECIES: ABC transporter ATP-binding protein [Flavobacterium]|uniref:ABC transporter ATP-binding protein n=2 Tax=Flavobacterium TaxID=237 RepID=A0A2N9P9Z2_9FLAO|nr:MULTISPECIES: ABC transporter ATP-binding protein [Flavobacterium]QYS88523.1 ABC transporter ATP-binding protein [Flavobacterium davisii]RVU91954.1 ABC transporter ATP-binding protein [Flavobacterium columnare]SPE77141.1 putative siderophore transport system ATP-binding protein YusV [Flavobacterium columnare]